MKRILYLDHTAKLGGGELAMLDLLVALDKTCFTPIVILASDGKLRERLKSANIETHVIPLNTHIVEMRKDKLGLSSMFSFGASCELVNYAMRLSRWAMRNSIDLIHTNSLKADLYGALTGKIAGIPVIWHIRDNIDSRYLPRLVAEFFRWLSTFLPDFIVTNSTSTLRTLKFGDRADQFHEYAPHPGGREAVVYSGVAINEIAHEAASNIRGQSEEPGEKITPIIALIGRITPWKGQDVYLRACRRILQEFPSTKCWIVGSALFGEEEFAESLEQLAIELGIRDQVEFLGFRDDVRELLKRVDVVVHASTVGEPFGQVVVQGMLAGKPVVGTNGGALPEIIVPGETGILVPMNDPKSLANAVITLLNNPVLAKKMGHAGRERVEDRFTTEHASIKIKRVYERVLGMSDSSLANSDFDQSYEPEVDPSVA